MRKALIGAVLGLLVGAGFGTLLALLIHLNRPVEPDITIWPPLSTPPTVSTRWINYSDLAVKSWVFNESLLVPDPKEDPLSPMLFLGILLGGGFGAVVGVVTGGTSAVVRAIQDSHPAMNQVQHPGEDMP